MLVERAPLRPASALCGGRKGGYFLARMSWKERGLGGVGGSSLSRAAESMGTGARSPGGPLSSLQLVPTVFPEPALRFVRVMGAGSTEVLGAGEWG